MMSNRRRVLSVLTTSDESSRGPLANARYDDQAEDFVRFREKANDAAVRAVVAQNANDAESSRDEFRSSLGADGRDILRLFAERRILAARRQASISLVDESLDAFALVGDPANVPWDTWIKAGLFVARSLGRDLDSLASRFYDVANEATSSRFHVALDSMNRITTLEQCRIIEVTTSYGAGFVRQMVIGDHSPSGFLSAAPPRPVDHLVNYAPISNLAQLAVSLADGIDATLDAITGPVVQSQLAATAFSLITPGSTVPTTGCLSFYATETAANHSVSVVVAELDEETDVKSLAESAVADDQAVFFDDRRLILMMTEPSFDDVEIDLDLERYRHLATAALANTSASAWRPR
jgi:hypothetical protein